MKGLILFVFGGIVGAVLAIVFAGGALTGAGAGVGIVTGLKAGACLTVEAAKGKGLISEDQVDELLSAAAGLIAESGADDPQITGGSAACEEILRQMKHVVAPQP